MTSHRAPREHRHPWLAGWRPYVVSRRPVRLLAFASAISAAGVLVGMQQLAVVISGVPTGSPLWAYLPIASGTMILVCAEGHMQTLDAVSARPIAMYNGWYAVAGVIVTSAVAFIVSLIGGLAGTSGLTVESGAALGLGTARNTAAWLGICAIAARVVGTRFCWIPGVALIVPIELLGKMDGVVRPWAFPAAPPTDAISWVIAAVFAVAGIVATALTPWQVRRLWAHPSRRTARRTSAGRATASGTEETAR